MSYNTPRASAAAFYAVASVSGILKQATRDRRHFSVRVEADPADGSSRVTIAVRDPEPDPEEPVVVGTPNADMPPG